MRTMQLCPFIYSGTIVPNDELVHIIYSVDSTVLLEMIIKHNILLYDMLAYFTESPLYYNNIRFIAAVSIFNNTLETGVTDYEKAYEIYNHYIKDKSAKEISIDITQKNIIKQKLKKRNIEYVYNPICLTITRYVEQNVLYKYLKNCSCLTLDYMYSEYMDNI